MSSRQTANFIDALLKLKPKIAVLDCDGTLWSNNSGEDFFYWSMKQRLVSPEIEKWARGRYERYRKGLVDEGVMCGEMTTMYRGLRVEDMKKAAARFFAEVVKPNYFLEMQSLTKALAAQGCELWAVSSTNEWVIREGIREFDIPAKNVLAAAAECKNGIVEDKLLRMPSGQGKAVAIHEVIQRPVDAVFGNSIHDAAMLELAKHAYAVNPNPDLASVAAERNWTIYWPEKTRAVSANT